MRLKNLITQSALTLMLVLGLSSSMASAAALTVTGGSVGHFAASSKDTACQALNTLDSSQGCGTKGNGVTNILNSAVSVLSIVAGAAAIIMIILSGFRYITSGGDPQRVSGARSALIYAMVGVAVAGLAQFLVHFVLNQATHP